MLNVVLKFDLRCVNCECCGWGRLDWFPAQGQRSERTTHIYVIGYNLYRYIIMEFISWRRSPVESVLE